MILKKRWFLKNNRKPKKYSKEKTKAAFAHFLQKHWNFDKITLKEWNLSYFFLFLFLDCNLTENKNQKNFQWRIRKAAQIQLYLDD